MAAAEGRIHRRLEQPPVVLAEFLGLVESKVRLDDHGVDVGVLDPRQHRAAARLDAQRVAGNVDLALEPGEYLVEDSGQMAFVVDPVDEDHELVAAEAADLDGIAGEGGEPLRDGVDQPVADGMPQRVVDALEVVEIEHGEAAAAILVAGEHGLGHELVEIGAVRQTGQIVVARHGADFFLGLDALRNVFERDDAELLAAFPGRELEMLAVGKRNEDLAVPSLAKRARQLPFDELAILGGEHPARHASTEHGMDGSSKQRIGRLERHQMRSFRVCHHDTARRP